RRFCKAFAITILLLVASVTTATAHAALVATDPAEGSTLPSALGSLTLSFTEPVAPIAFSLVGVGGMPQALDMVSADGPVVTLALPPALKDGSYLASWRVTSEDGHPVNGTVSFVVGTPSGDIVGPPPDRTLASAIWLVRAAQYLALFIGLGTLASRLWTPMPPAARSIGLGLTLAGLILAPLAIALQGLDLLGLPLTSLWDAAPVRAGLASSYGSTQLTLGAAFLLGALSQLGLFRRPQRVLLALGAICAALAPTLSGHASTAAPQWLMRPAVLVHIAGLLFWIGALLPLSLLLADRSRTGLEALARFSRHIPYAVIALILSGLILAIVQLGPPDRLWVSGYGILLGTKLLAVAMLLALALHNRAVLTPLALAGHRTGSRRLRLSIAAEMLLVLAVLGLVAGWRFTPPPRALHAVMSASATTQLPGEVLTATIVATPGHAGPMSVAIALVQPSGAPVPARSVMLRLSLPQQGIATISRPATETADNWMVSGVTLPVAGIWQISVEIRTSEFDLTILNGSIAITTNEEHSMPSHSSTALRRHSWVIVIAALFAQAPMASAHDGLIHDGCDTGQSWSAGDIAVSGAYTRAMLPNAKSAAGYMVIENTGADADRLIGVKSEAATTIDVHQMKMNGEMMEMSPIEGGLEIPAHGKLELAPMGYHLMFTGIATPFKQGECVQIFLEFQSGHELPITLNIGSVAQDGPVMDHDMSGMSSMEGM
ncbi:MAG: copper chaperone PCu(A)C, partial [Devosia sp.]